MQNNQISTITTTTTPPPPHYHHHSPPSSLFNNNYNNNNNILLRVNGAQACAACKYQRRKCAADCVLAPYFPHDRQRQFLNAHKLFGVSNITKIIRHLDQPLKDEAMRTIIFQSDVRAVDPVGGCYRIIRDLQRHIDYCRAELDIVLHNLAYCRAQAAAAAGAGGEDSFTDNNCDGVVVNQAETNLVNDATPYEQNVEYQQQYDIEDAQLDLAEMNFSWAGMHEHEQEHESTSTSELKEHSVNEQCDDLKPILDSIPGYGEEEDLRFENHETFQHRDEAILQGNRDTSNEEVEAITHAARDYDDDLKGAANSHLPSQTVVS